jgi:hypothetical protein
MQAFIGLAVLTAFVMLFVVIFRLAKKQKAALAQALAVAGFQAVPHFESDVDQQLRSLLNARRPKLASVKNIYRYSGLDYELFRFDVPGNDNDNTRYALVFKRPLLPAFAIMPHLKLPGFLDSLVKKLLLSVIGGAGYTEVQVHGRPQFQEKYRLYAKDGHHLLNSVPMHVWEELCALSGRLSLQGEGRVLLFQELITVQNRKSNNTAAELKRMIERSDALFRVFRDIQPAGVWV